ncbi:MAG: S8 family serine peptidase [Hyphomicrobiaceae bacterium]|nr:S8 family serine peptidase [Hyphomicrobiaceae bacterium]
MRTWHEVDPRPGYDGFGTIDPYVDWAFGTGAQSAGGYSRHGVAGAKRPKGAWHPLLLDLPQVDARSFADGRFLGALAPADWQQNVRVPEIGASAQFSGSRFVVAHVRPAFFDYFTQTELGGALRSAIARMGVSEALETETIASPTAAGAVASVPTGAAEPGTVVVGVIDDGLAFANERFRTRGGKTRVAHLWLQDGVANAAAGRYGYGRVLSAHDIDSVLAKSTHAGLVDEDEVYRKTEAVAFSGTAAGARYRTASLAASHGTHVMDLAAGYRPGGVPGALGGANEDARPIVAVQLPAASSEGTSGASLDTFTIDAVRFILDKADEIARGRGCGRLPVVINFSYGTIAGRHDGTSDLERALDEVIAERRGTMAPVEIVLPAGNNRLKRCHATLTFGGAADSRIVAWRVQPDDRTMSHLEIWLPRGAPTGRVRIAVKPPGGDWGPALGEATKPVRVWGDTPDRGLCSLRYAHVPPPTGRGMFLVSLQPTEIADVPPGDVPWEPSPSGVWCIRVENVSLGEDEAVEVWVQRDDTRFGHPAFGRQSMLDDPEYVAVEDNGLVPDSDASAAMVKRAGTLNPISTGEHTIVIGGYCHSNYRVADYSGEGLAASPRRLGPDALAPSDESIVARGILAAGTRSGTFVALQGTSAAVAMTTRSIADRLAQGKAGDRDAIRAVAAAEEAAATGSRPERPSEARGGAGRLGLGSSLPVKRVDEA